MSEDTNKSDEQVTKTEDTSGLKATNAQLKREKQDALDRLKEFEDAAEKAAEEAATKKGDWEKLEKKLRDDHAKELAARDTVIAERDTSLKALTIDNAIKSEAARLGVKPELLPAVEALMKQQAKYENGVATIADKSISEAMSEWATKDGLHFIRADDNAGSGATGSSAKAAAMTAETWNYTKWSETLATNPAEAKAMAIACGKTDLANSIV